MKKNNNGFTIIEVVLVLAIAGLIFLAVFIALPALQRGQRDNQRRSDAARFASQLQSYATNNNGKVPTASNIATFRTNYLTNAPEGFRDPSTGNSYTITVPSKLTTVSSSTGRFHYHPGYKCNDEAVVASSGPRIAAITIKLEGSGVYCLDSQK